ncbi:hypothetical protein BDW67DRAFT_171281 [Aspergillus spinulosporus]
MHILVVEDNKANQKRLTRLLHRLSCTVSIAHNGQEALDYLSASPVSHPRPDIILMDVVAFRIFPPSFSIILSGKREKYLKKSRNRPQCP